MTSITTNQSPHAKPPRHPAPTEGRDLSQETLAGGPWLPTARLHHPRPVPIYSARW